MIFPSCIKRNEILRAPVYLKTKPEYAKWVQNAKTIVSIISRPPLVQGKKSFRHNNNDVLGTQMPNKGPQIHRTTQIFNKFPIMNNFSAVQKLKNIILPIGLHLCIQYVVRIANGSHSQTAFGLCTQYVQRQILRGFPKNYKLRQGS